MDIDSLIPESPESFAIELRSTEGGADKVYIVAMASEPEMSGYSVSYQNGRRGGTLASGMKTKAPVSYAEARAVVAKLLKEKIGKGYKVHAEGQTFIVAIGKTDTGIRPMLLNPITRDEAVSLLRTGRFALQEKHDGERRMLIVKDGDVKGVNRKGQEVGLPQSIISAASILPDCVIDGEQIGDAYHAFDLIEHSGADLRSSPFLTRLEGLRTLAPLLIQGAITTSRTVTTIDEALDMMRHVEERGGEGIVLKQMDATYGSGRPNSGGPALKLKFVQTASCIVMMRNEQRSVGLGLITDDDAAFEDMAFVGNVTIPANHAIPAVGAVVEVRYLYAFRSGSLFQPVYLGERPDLDRSEARASQLVYKDEARAA